MKTKTDIFLKIIQRDNHDLVMLRIHGQVGDFILSLFYFYFFLRWNISTILKVPFAPLAKEKKIRFCINGYRLFHYNPGAVFETFRALFLP